MRVRQIASPAAWLIVVAAGLTAQGCTPAPVAQGPAARVYAVDVQGGARSCTVPKSIALAPGKQISVAMAVGNDGGWCGISVEKGGAPYDAGLLVDRPQHGRVSVHTVGDATRIDYTPGPGYVGPDSFTAQLLPGDPTMQVNVTVTR